MTLEEFKNKKKLSYRQLAKNLGISGKSPESTVQRWCKGKRIPEKNFMEKIKQITKGKVTANDFYH
jgi:transcriptional regulator with XRE-family HTH domain|tara:strand:- start:2573 stop:2770 length:198 start_codon:yes stop_codon:yes gene_type:complete